MQRTGAVCQKAAAPLKAIGVTVSEESIRAYLEDLNHRGRREETEVYPMSRTILNFRG